MEPLTASVSSPVVGLTFTFAGRGIDVRAVFHARFVIVVPVRFQRFIIVTDIVLPVLRISQPIGGTVFGERPTRPSLRRLVIVQFIVAEMQIGIHDRIGVFFGHAEFGDEFFAECVFQFRGKIIVHGRRHGKIESARVVGIGKKVLRLARGGRIVAPDCAEQKRETENQKNRC